jgi:hypothetical protein
MKAQNISKYHGFKALLNGKIAVEVAFETAENNGEWLTAGYIYYPKAKNPAPILIVNDWGDEKLEDLTSAVTLEMRNELQWMSEDDINFDGIPDLKVYMGVTQNGSSTYKCFVWNPVTRIFYPVPEFEEILEADFDSKSKTITSIARSYTTTYIDVYKWKNCRLRKVSSKSIP